jgi:hypothetical protein
VTAREKIDAAVDYLADRGVSWASAAPPHYGLLWVFGIHIPPPHFQSFLGLFLFNAFFYGLLCAVLALLFERHHAVIEVTLWAGSIGGFLVGILVAAYYRWRALRLGLPSWSDFVANDSEDEAGW